MMYVISVQCLWLYEIRPPSNMPHRISNPQAWRKVISGRLKSFGSSQFQRNWTGQAKRKDNVNPNRSAAKHPNIVVRQESRKRFIFLLLYLVQIRLLNLRIVPQLHVEVTHVLYSHCLVLFVLLSTYK